MFYVVTELTAITVDLNSCFIPKVSCEGSYVQTYCHMPGRLSGSWHICHYIIPWNDPFIGRCNWIPNIILPFLPFRGIFSAVKWTSNRSIDVPTRQIDENVSGTLSGIFSAITVFGRTLIFVYWHHSIISQTDCEYSVICVTVFHLSFTALLILVSYSRIYCILLGLQGICPGCRPGGFSVRMYSDIL